MMQLSEQQCYYVAPTASHSAAPLRRGRNSQLSFRDIVKVYDALILTSDIDSIKLFMVLFINALQEERRERTGRTLRALVLYAF